MCKEESRKRHWVGGCLAAAGGVRTFLPVKYPESLVNHWWHFYLRWRMVLKGKRIASITLSLNQEKYSKAKYMDRENTREVLIFSLKVMSNCGTNAKYVFLKNKQSSKYRWVDKVQLTITLTRASQGSEQVLVFYEWSWLLTSGLCFWPGWSQLDLSIVLI